MNNEYFGRGYAELYEDYIDFINYVFGFNGHNENFVSLLPKLYKPEYKPLEDAYVALIDGKLRAAVGTQNHDIMVAGTKLTCRGVGNVAVHPFTRSRGYMRKLMDMALEDMVSDKIDMSVLGGRRQRYNYFSYEKTGTLYDFTINEDNLRHCFGADRSAYHTMTFPKLDKNDIGALENIKKLLEGQVYYPCRPAEKLYDILCSWSSTPYVVSKAGRFAGYFIYKSETVFEIALCDKDDFINTIIALFDEFKLKKLTIKLPPFEVDYISRLCIRDRGYTIGTAASFSVLNFGRVVVAFIRLKASYEELPDGELRLLIHGRAGDENIRIYARGGVCGVEANDGAYDLELEHIDAINLLFSPFCPGRERLPGFARVWLPLPIWLPRADGV